MLEQSRVELSTLKGLAVVLHPCNRTDELRGRVHTKVVSWSYLPFTFSSQGADVNGKLSSPRSFQDHNQSGCS